MQKVHTREALAKAPYGDDRGSAATVAPKVVHGFCGATGTTGTTVSERAAFHFDQEREADG